MEFLCTWLDIVTAFTLGDYIDQFTFSAKPSPIVVLKWKVTQTFSTIVKCKHIHYHTIVMLYTGNICDDLKISSLLCSIFNLSVINKWY